MLDLSISDLHVDPPGMKVETWGQVLTNVEADLRVSVDGLLVLQRRQTCVVELAYCLAVWMKGPVEAGDAFIFSSMDEEEERNLWFERTSSGLWRIGSVWQSRPSPGLVTGGDLLRACDAFIAQLERSVLDVLGFNLGQMAPEYREARDRTEPQ